MSQQQTTSTPAAPTPDRRTRMKEKEELQHLNDRFVTYINRVRRLRDEKDRLNVTLEHMQTTTQEESGAVKRIFEKELQDARLLIDETAKEKARYQILATKNEDRVKDLETELKEYREEYERMQHELSEAKKSAETFESLYKSALVDNQTAKQKIQELEDEVEELRSRLKETQESLERETLAKVDLQNQIQSLREELAFKKKVYDEELITIRRTGFTTIQRDGVEETDDDFAERLQAAIDEAREEIEKETEQFKLDLEKTYKTRIDMLESQGQRDAGTITRLDGEVKSSNSSLTKCHRDITKLQEKNEHLEISLRDKTEELTRAKQLHNDEIAHLMDEMRTLRANYEQKIKEYEELFDLRIQLEQEIATLSALLQEEEIRLNLQTTPREKRPRMRDSEGPRSKRQKQVTATSSSAVGFIQIVDVDPDGRFVQIKNMSDKIEALGGFKIVHEVENTGDKVEFRFHSKSKLQGGAAVTVWATGADGAVHSPPTDIIWKSVSNWGCGPRTSTSLCTKAGEVVATFTQRKEESFTETTPLPPPDIEVPETDAGIQTFPSIPLTTPVRVSPTSTSRVTTREREQEQIFHQQDDPPPIDERQRESCLIS